MHPVDAIAAASHRDPYPYYRQLLAGPPLYFDAGLQLWIASRAAVIRTVLDDPHCRVRPPGERDDDLVAIFRTKKSACTKTTAFVLVTFE